MKRGATPLALPLGELSPKVTERAFSLFSLSVFASLNRLSQKETRGTVQPRPYAQKPRRFWAYPCPFFPIDNHSCPCYNLTDKFSGSSRPSCRFSGRAFFQAFSAERRSA